MVTRIIADGDILAASRDGLTGPPARPTEADEARGPAIQGRIERGFDSCFSFSNANRPIAGGDGRW